MTHTQLHIGNEIFSSRLFLGTGKFSNPSVMEDAVRESGSELVTVALKRIELGSSTGIDILSSLRKMPIRILPNTSGARTAKEAVFVAKLCRDALETNLIKLEIHPDPQYLLPDPIETLLAAEELADEGFTVFPYVQADPVLCKRLEDVGAACVMPLGAPIGSNQGLQTLRMLEIIIEQSRVPVVIDAGLGAPSHAAHAFELGADAVLVNTAIAVSSDPVAMAKGFRLACEAGFLAKEAQLAKKTTHAMPSSPLLGFLDLAL
jgi:thiazole synthase